MVLWLVPVQCFEVGVCFVVVVWFFLVRYCCFVVCELSVRGLQDVLWFLECFVVSVLLLCGVGKVCCGW